MERSEIPNATINDRLSQETRNASEYGVTLLDRRGRESYLPYPKIYERAEACAMSLIALGIKPGERVAIMVPTSFDFFDAFFGTLLAGAVPTPMYPPVRLGRIDEFHERSAAMLDACDAKLLLTDARVAKVSGRTIEGAKKLRLGLRIISDLQQATTVSLPEVNSQDLALVQFSSGTTSSPKAVALSHDQLLWNCDIVLQSIMHHYPETNSDHVCVSWLPLYHDMGLIGCVLSATLKGRNLVLIPPEAFVARPQLWFEAIAKHRGTISAAPNFAYAMAAERVPDAALQNLDLSSWVIALNGAEAVTPESIALFCERLAPHGFKTEALCPVYGLAEATLAVSFSSPKEAARPTLFSRQSLEKDGIACPPDPRGEVHLSLSDVGQPLKYTKIQIRGPDDETLDEGRVGEIVVQSPSVMKEYLGDKESTNKVIKEGWLKTGDRGFVFESKLYIYGRSKDIIIINGRNYAPHDIEVVVSEIDGIRKGCVVACGHLIEDQGEQLMLYAERSKGNARNEAVLGEDIRNAVLERCGLKVAQISILEPGTLPRTSSGKLRRRETLKRYLGGTLAPPEKVTTFFLLKEMVKSKWAMGKRSS